MTIEITDEMKQYADDFADKMIEMKMKEKQYRNDCGQLRKRILTGLYGEMAVFIALGYKYTDTDNSVAYTAFYSHSDLLQIGFFNTGIKTVEKGKSHVIYKHNVENQILCIVNDDIVNIVGIATIDMLNDIHNQNDDLILSPALKNKGFKTCFCGMDKLLDFSLDNLCALE